MLNIAEAEGSVMTHKAASLRSGAGCRDESGAEFSIVLKGQEAVLCAMTIREKTVDYN
jgi:hypothetical protein